MKEVLKKFRVLEAEMEEAENQSEYCLIMYILYFATAYLSIGLLLICVFC